MRVKEKGFSLLEVLIALGISSVLLIGAARLLPALQLGVLRQAQQTLLQEELWQLAFTIGKQIQRAGYCYGGCQSHALELNSEGNCLLVQWDANSNGRFEGAPSSEAEQTGYRLRDGSLETQRGATSCEGKGWEKMTNPAMVRIDRFQIQEKRRPGFAPLFTVALRATMLRYHGDPVAVEHSVSGFNL
ncbi:prepilin peptidase-dependent protein [Cronobacter turicensis]|jgi:prepilin peptidase dependent protein B|uniref:prepilin peptidase-dependent protein n=1 Tax=Cronobacter turicensis TaxID=413502 RepID=UPI0024C26283|nr:prepilin peptidase-dependent protein [Cronobacter turicensis]EKY3193899.1 prepilin peptidase-dependent protein [Cronobacter turicensis]ELY4129826.1 prepilin peptidase-dependent protein [Cronobacter turicensis]ELY4349682.1 prepilin peptidase-dependent protein [Cronobacter turicensis]ELY5849694.1 prepilin peptidase-dependent protein [Cronobacter turicensis]ELY6278832.1 prepilin peptidase-dependent protein [Cronobacter turicensis]